MIYDSQWACNSCCVMMRRNEWRQGFKRCSIWPPQNLGFLKRIRTRRDIWWCKVMIFLLWISTNRLVTPLMTLWNPAMKKTSSTCSRSQELKHMIWSIAFPVNICDLNIAKFTASQKVWGCYHCWILVLKVIFVERREEAARKGEEKIGSQGWLQRCSQSRRSGHKGVHPRT